MKNNKLKQPTKFQFFLGFFAVVALLWGVKRLVTALDDSLHAQADAAVGQVIRENRLSAAATVPHRILSVPNYKTALPDSQSVQIKSKVSFHRGLKLIPTFTEFFPGKVISIVY